MTGLFEHIPYGRIPCSSYIQGEGEGFNPVPTSWARMFLIPMEGLTPSEEWMEMRGREGEGVEQEDGWVELYLVYKVKKNF